MRSRKFCADTVLPEVYNDPQKKMLNSMSMAEFVGITMDKWTCTMGDILTSKKSHLSTNNAEKLLILKENLLKF